jgi:DNA-binding CsgD family transcriptional regulator
MAGYAMAARRELLLLLPRGAGVSADRLLGPRPRNPRCTTRVVMADGVRDRLAPAVRSLSAADRIRFSPQAVTSWLLVADRDVAVLSRRGHSIELRSPAAVETLVGIFESHWRFAERTPRTGESPLSELERHIIDRLSAGLTDAAVAGELAVSARTIQRHVKRVMGLCGARSRLELGIRLAHRNLI